MPTTKSFAAKLYIKLEELDAALIYYQNIVNDYYDTEFVNSALTNISLIYCIDDIKKAKAYLDEHKNNFLDISNFKETFELVDSLKLNEDESYYLSYLK